MKYFLQLLILLSATSAFSQTAVRRCGTMENDSLMRIQNHTESLADFEIWLQAKIAQQKQLPINKNGRSVITIPIIFHVIHNGDAEGVNENLSQAQVISQIDVLNEDYRKLAGTPGFNTNPVGADIEFEFCPAVVDPNGNILPQPGIDRINMNQASWTQAQCNSTLKPQTYWNPDLYCNVWTVNFGGSSVDLLGFTQFPNSSLAGVGTNNGGASTDGIVIRYDACGRVGTLDATYNGGRTLTHEMGHWFGLRHIWGDGNNCSATDYCDDTPKASQANYGCPTKNSCNDGTPDPNDMVQNYMDYTDDACMNIFTNDQKTRMQTIINNAPRRVTLLTSDVCSMPVTYLFTGQVKDAASNTGIANAKVLLDGNIDYNATTDTNGNFSVSVKAGNYTIYAGKWGYVTNTIGAVNITAASPAATVLLSKGYYDDFLFDFAWTQSGNATTGKWVRGVPVGTTYTSGATSLQANPGADVTGDYGSQCLITGNGGGTASNDDVDNGTTIITSPIMDLSSYTNPKLTYYRWFFDNSGNGTTDDSLVISITNGTQTVVVDKIGATTNPQSQWISKSFNITGLLPLNNSMRLIVRTFDLGTGNVVEAGFDLFQLIDSVPALPAAPIANFTVAGSEICAGSAVSFNDLSANLPTSWSWSFPGGTPATDTTSAPVVHYNTPGVYPVTLQVSNGLGSDTKSVTNFITVNAVVADYTATKTAICPNDTITFSSISSCNPAGYQWQFQGGSPATSTAAGQVVSYAAPGLYDVTLVASNTYGSDTLVRNLSIQVHAQPTATTAAVSDTNGAGMGSVSATAASGAAPYSYLWSPGNLTTSTVAHLSQGTYTVTITDANGCKVTSSVVVNNETVGINETDMQWLNIYPNPSSGKFNVHAHENHRGQLQVFNTVGQLLTEQSTEAPVIDLSNFSSGIYTVKLMVNNKLIGIKKLVKE
ncbi:MAG: PKD domain-containing protein [Chitinophagales bacterium]